MSARVFGHFGEWLQGRLGQDGPLVLLTVACPALHVTVSRAAAEGFSICQSVPVVSPERAQMFLQRVGGQTGRYSIGANMPPGGGAGASTAAFVALARAAGGDPDKLIDACLAAEGASDPLMLAQPDRVLWASRAGRVVAQVPALPKAEVIGGFWGDPIATDASDLGFDDIRDLVAQLKPGMSLPELARLSSISAKRCTVLRGPLGDPTEALAQGLGAHGFIRAHTGSARGLVFAPGQVPADAERALQKAGFCQVLRFQTGGAGA